VLKDKSWILLVCCFAILLMIDRDNRMYWLPVLFLAPLFFMIWRYWGRGYEEQFDKLREEKLALEKKFAPYKLPNPDYFNGEIYREEIMNLALSYVDEKKCLLEKQKDRDVNIFCGVLFLSALIFAIIIGLIGWNNFIELWES
jgi:hypothetical protein